MNVYGFASILGAAICALHSVHAANAQHVDFTKLNSEERAEVLSAVVIEKIDFNNESVLQCLQDISRRCAKQTGMGFSVVAKNVKDEMTTPITLRAERITVKELFSHIGKLAGVSVKLTRDACVVEKSGLR